MGLKNSGPSFQRMIEAVLHGLDGLALPLLLDLDLPHLGSLPLHSLPLPPVPLLSVSLLPLRPLLVESVTFTLLLLSSVPANIKIKLDLDKRTVLFLLLIL